MNKKELPKRRNGFYYLDDNRIYPSVTSVLQILAKPALISWAARESARAALADPTLTEQEASSIIYSRRGSAADRGRAIHSFAELYQAGANIEVESLPEEWRPYANAFISFVKAFQPKIVCRERLVYSDSLKYAGTLDFIMQDMKGETYLVDIKTGKDIYNEYALQLKAYQQAVNEMGELTVKKTAILLLSEDGTFKFADMDSSEKTLGAFLAAKTLWEFFNQDKIEGSKPKKKGVE